MLDATKHTHRHIHAGWLDMLPGQLSIAPPDSTIIQSSLFSRAANNLAVSQPALIAGGTGAQAALSSYDTCHPEAATACVIEHDTDLLAASLIGPPDTSPDIHAGRRFATDSQGPGRSILRVESSLQVGAQCL